MVSTASARIMCDVLGCGPADVVAGTSAYSARARANHAAQGRDRAVEVLDGLLGWMECNGGALTGSGSSRG